MRYYYISITTAQNREHRQCQMLVRMWNNRRSHSLLVGMQNSMTTLADTLVVSYKSKHTRGFPGGAVVDNLPANAGDTGSSPGLGRSHMPRSN